MIAGIIAGGISSIGLMEMDAGVAVGLGLNE
jgi:hypothetical protein